MPKSIKETLKEQLLSPNDHVRDTVLESLLKGYTSEARDVLDQIIYGNDTILKIYLCRYISKYAHTRKGLLILQELMKNKNESLRKEAEEAFDKIESMEKRAVCLQMLQSDLEWVVDFAVDQVQKYHYRAAIEHLMRIYDGICDDISEEAVSRKIKIIRVLRQMRRTESIKTLFKMSETDNEKILYEVIYTLGLFSRHIKPFRFLSYMRHKSPTIRKVTVWVLNRYKSKKIRRDLIDHFFLEKNPFVKNEIIDGLSGFNDYKIARALLHMAVHGESNVRLLAESALYRLSNKMKYALFKQYKSHKNVKVRVCVTLNSSQCEGRKMHRMLCSILTDDENPHVRAAAAEALSMRANRSVVQNLYNAFMSDSDELVRYTALMGLTRLWNHDDENDIRSVLELSEDDDTQAIIIALRFIQKKILRENWSISASIADRALFRVSSKNPQIRYLSMEILCLVRDKRALIPLVECYMNAETPAEKQMILTAVEKIIYDDPMILFGFLIQARRRKPVFCAILEIMSNVALNKNYHYEIVLQLAMLFLREQVKALKVKIVSAFFTIFQAVYHTIPELAEVGNEHWIQVILRCAKYAREEELAIFGADIFLKNINHSDCAVQKIVIIMLGILQEEKAIKDLTEISLSHKSPVIRQLARESLAKIISMGNAA